MVPARDCGFGVLVVITLEAGWTVSEVGRQPWIVDQKMKVVDAATAKRGVWIIFVLVLLCMPGWVSRRSWCCAG